MTSSELFRRSAVLALAWCLVGLGIDTGTDARPRPEPGGTSRRAAVARAGHFASARPADDRAAPATLTRPIPAE